MFFNLNSLLQYQIKYYLVPKQFVLIRLKAGSVVSCCTDGWWRHNLSVSDVNTLKGSGKRGSLDC